MSMLFRVGCSISFHRFATPVASFYGIAWNPLSFLVPKISSDDTFGFMSDRHAFNTVFFTSYAIISSRSRHIDDKNRFGVEVEHLRGSSSGSFMIINVQSFRPLNQSLKKLASRGISSGEFSRGSEQNLVPLFSNSSDRAQCSRMPSSTICFLISAEIINDSMLR